MYKYLILLYFLIFSSSVAWAQGAPARDVGARASGVAVLAGGVGEESVAALLPRQGEFNLKLVFTLVEGDYVADVAAKIIDSNGRVVLDTVSEGPLLLVRLPPANYRATLTYAGVTQTRKFSLRGVGLATQQFRWKRSAADGEPLL